MTKSQVTDLQAIVLCGSGHRLNPLVDEEKLPKCMLPIANRPMLYYPLTWLLQAGINGMHLYNNILPAHVLLTTFPLLSQRYNGCCPYDRWTAYPELPDSCL